MKKLSLLLAAIAVLTGCPSQWKVQGGPQECVKMCDAWGMKLTGMVGVGDQGRATGGASACICELPRSSGSSAAAAGTTASMAAAVVAMQQAQQQQQAAQAAMQAH